MLNQTSLLTALSLQNLQTSTKNNAQINRVYPSEGLILSITTLTCRNNNTTTLLMAIRGRVFPKPWMIPLTTLILVEWKNPTLGPWGLHENEPQATTFIA